MKTRTTKAKRVKRVRAWIEVDSNGTPLGCPESDYIVSKKKPNSYFLGRRIPSVRCTITYELPALPTAKGKKRLANKPI